MNADTGEITQFKTKEEAVAAGFTVPLRCEPKRNCSKCHGTGSIGRNDMGKHVPCSCTQKRERKRST